MPDTGAPPSLDLAVLADLRGYPRELERFTNLMKQSPLAPPARDHLGAGA